MRDGTVLAKAEVAHAYGERVSGLLGRSGYEGAFVIPGTRWVHTLGMRFALDVAFLDEQFQVLAVVHLSPWRLTLPRWRARCVLEAESGAFERWGLHTGDTLELADIP
jgi:uncharacterized membrane protein (UPF0127 family)